MEKSGSLPEIEACADPADPAEIGLGILLAASVAIRAEEKTHTARYTAGRNLRMNHLIELAVLQTGSAYFTGT
jgi:hypothetical protein